MEKKWAFFMKKGYNILVGWDEWVSGLGHFCGGRRLPEPTFRAI
jgi:hypothetical protein